MALFHTPCGVVFPVGKLATNDTTCQEIYHEEDLSAPEYQEEAHPRLSSSHAHQERPRRDQPLSRQGPQEIKRLGWPKSRRLLRSAEFTSCYEQGEKHFTKHFVCFVLCRKGGPPGFRLGLTVSRKMGPAVARNRIKRVVREFFRLHQDDVPQGTDLVIVPKRTLDVTRLNLDLATKEFAPLLSRIRTARSRGA